MHATTTATLAITGGKEKSKQRYLYFMSSAKVTVVSFQDRQIPRHARADTLACAHSHMCALPHVRTPTRAHSHTHTPTCIRLHIHAHICMYANIHTRTHYMHASTHTTNTHTLSGSLSKKSFLPLLIASLRLKQDNVEGK